MLKYIITFILGMCPIIEIRGAIPVGVGMGLSYLEAFLIGFIGNIIPIYFIVKYIGPIFDFLRKFKIFNKIIDWATNKATKKIEESPRLQNFTALGLLLLSPIALPTIGATTSDTISIISPTGLNKGLPIGTKRCFGPWGKNPIWCG